MAKLTECDYCAEQEADSSPLLKEWIREPENSLDFCSDGCREAWHDENEPESDNNGNELVELDE